MQSRLPLFAEMCTATPSKSPGSLSITNLSPVVDALDLVGTPRRQSLGLGRLHSPVLNVLASEFKPGVDKPEAKSEATQPSLSVAAPAFVPRDDVSKPLTGASALPAAAAEAAAPASRPLPPPPSDAVLRAQLQRIAAELTETKAELARATQRAAVATAAEESARRECAQQKLAIAALRGRLASKAAAAQHSERSLREQLTGLRDTSAELREQKESLAAQLASASEERRSGAQAAAGVGASVPTGEGCTLLSGLLTKTDAALPEPPAPQVPPPLSASEPPPPADKPAPPPTLASSFGGALHSSRLPGAVLSSEALPSFASFSIEAPMAPSVPRLPAALLARMGPPPVQRAASDDVRLTQLARAFDSKAVAGPPNRATELEGDESETARASREGGAPTRSRRGGRGRGGAAKKERQMMGAKLMGEITGDATGGNENRAHNYAHHYPSVKDCAPPMAHGGVGFPTNPAGGLDHSRQAGGFVGRPRHAALEHQQHPLLSDRQQSINWQLRAAQQVLARNA